MKRHAPFFYLLTSLMLFAAGVALAGRLLAVQWNSTPSYPLGLWRVCSSNWAKGDLVVVDVPPRDARFSEALVRGYLHAGSGDSGCAPLLKRVVAVAGDVVTVTDRVLVNGREVPGGRLLRTDAHGRPLPHAARSGVVAAGSVWVMSEYSDRSFDSRYFGALPAALIRGRAEPLWTW